MRDEDEQAWYFVEKYLHNSKPVQWVNWMARCNDEKAKTLLKSTLFEDDALRDLTDPRVKEEVMEVISETSALLELVIADFAEELRLVEEKRKKQGSG